MLRTQIPKTFEHRMQGNLALHAHSRFAKLKNGKFAVLTQLKNLMYNTQPNI